MKKIFLFLAMAMMMAVSPAAQARTTSGKLINMGEFKLTAYCPCQRCSDHYGRLTSTGKYARSGHTIAVDPKEIAYGTKILIGDTVYIAEDCGGRVKGEHIDIFMDTHEEVEEFEVKHKNIWIVKGGFEQ